jgi:hypothetical protein
LLRKKLFQVSDFTESLMNMTIAVSGRQPMPNAAQYVAAFFRSNPVLAGVAVLMIFAMVPTLAAMAIDTRTTNGINGWEKPFKFQLALFMYAATLALYANWLPRTLRDSRAFRIFILVVAACIVLEMVWLVGAAANGVASHFNFSSAFMGATYQIMGLLAITLTSASLVFGIAFLRDSASALDPAFRLSLAQGLMLTFFATVIVAGFMSSGPGHWVGGTQSDVAGLALLGWSRDGGDLRVSHFFATHALHFVPAVGYLASKALLPAQARLAVYAASAAFTALIIFTFFQALAGRPFLPFL